MSGLSRYYMWKMGFKEIDSIVFVGMYRRETNVPYMKNYYFYESGWFKNEPI